MGYRSSEKELMIYAAEDSPQYSRSFQNTSEKTA